MPVAVHEANNGHNAIPSRLFHAPEMLIFTAEYSSVGQRTQYLNDPDPRSIQRRAEQDVPLEQVYSKWVVSENPQAHLQALEKLIDDGVTHIFLQSPRAAIRPKSSHFMANRFCPGCNSEVRG